MSSDSLYWIISTKPFPSKDIKILKDVKSILNSTQRFLMHENSFILETIKQ
jgi:hypothetical protein